MIVYGCAIFKQDTWGCHQQPSAIRGQPGPSSVDCSAGRNQSQYTLDGYGINHEYMGKPATIQENWDISETFVDSWANQLVKGQLFLLCQLHLLNIWRYHPFSHSY